MNITELIRKIASEYPDAKMQPLKGHALASFIRRDVPKVAAPIIDNPDLLVKASEGKGGWAESPWIAVINKKMTDAPQEGVYIVYLFSADLSKVYLTLAQGITRPVTLYGRPDALRRLRANAESIRANFSFEGFDDYADVKLGEGNRATAYEDSVIYAKKYITAALPDNDQLEDDLKNIVSFYTEYLDQRDVLTAETDFSSSIGEVEEGKRLLRQHYVRERNPRVIREAKKFALKKSGELRCEICNFCFKENYDGRTEDYIEGHHRKAVSEMKEGDRTLIGDIALLCSNCHRAIHAKWPYISVEELKKIFDSLKTRAV
jgi:5-methylcytosine-specific restriction protein A